MSNKKTRSLVAVLISIALFASVFTAGFAVGSGHLGSDIFEDVPKGHWADEAIGWAVSEGITSGVSDTRFDPDGTVTRAQIVTFLYRAIVEDEQLPVPSLSAASDWADAQVETLNLNAERDLAVYRAVADNIAAEAERLAVCDRTGVSYAAGAAAHSTNDRTATVKFVAFAAYGLVRAADECAARQNATVDEVEDLLTWANAGLRLVRYIYGIEPHGYSVRVGDLSAIVSTLRDWATIHRNNVQSYLDQLQD